MLKDSVTPQERAFAPAEAAGLDMEPAPCVV